MADPLVILLLRQFKADLLAREAVQMALMARRWIVVEDALDAAILRVAERIEELTEEGGTVSPSRILQLDRYRSLLAQAEREVMRYVSFADGDITAEQTRLGELAIEQSVQTINATYASANAVPGLFDVLPVDAIENMIGFAGDGSPLRALLEEAWPTSAQAMTEALIRATALGINPRETARRMREGLEQGLNRILTIARTEQLRVYREAGRQAYQESGVVTGYRRLATHDDRVCPACLFAEGQVYELDEPLDEHPNGRCAQVPIVKNLPPITWQTGPTWFNDQDAETQRSILGPGRYEAWQAGQFALDALISRSSDPTWGGSLTPTPLSDLTG